MEEKLSYYLRNKEKIKERSRKHYHDNKELKKQYYLDNKEKIISNSKKYYKENKDKRREYYLKNKEKIREYFKNYVRGERAKIYSASYRKKNKDLIKKRARKSRIIVRIKHDRPVENQFA